jgi:NitT/TauT family transport system permease protein
MLRADLPRALIVVWTVAAQFAGPRLLPAPQAVALALFAEASSGAFHQSGGDPGTSRSGIRHCMTLGTVAGLAMGRSRAADRFGDPGSWCR